MIGGRMDKFIEVKEFDSIIGNPNFRDDGKYRYLENEFFQNLESFIEEFSGGDDISDVLEFMRISYKRDVGRVITIKNYVGLIQMKNGSQIQVLPKINFASSDDVCNKDTKRVFLKMLKSMKDFPSKVFNDANLKIDRMNLYEIFISMYLQEVRRLVKRGIKSDYISETDNSKFFKGKLMTSQHIRNNILHKERFYISYDEFHSNSSENKLIKSTLFKLQKITTSAINSKEIRQLLTFFETVDPSSNYSLDFSKVQINRNTKDYEMLMKWSNVFLFNKSFTTFSGTSTSRALLFPMERVFESYIAQQVKKVLIPEGWQVSTQDKGYYLFTSPIKCFSLRPDIVCRRDNKTIIMDTKWKNIDKSKRKNYGISQSDMYQMYAYSKKYKASDVWLLYPLNDKMREHSDIVFESGDGTNVRIFFIDIENIEISLEQFKNKL